jgi:hypothetical protein
MTAGAPRLDDESEFGEGRREPIPWVDIHAEFVMSAADVLHEGVSDANHAGRAELFQARIGRSRDFNRP